MNGLAEVLLWGTRVGAVSQPDAETAAAFEYDPDFARSGIELSPIEMPLVGNRRYRFPALSSESFAGLPGLLADSLPDRYGNALIDAWLATQDRDPGSFDAVERLCYIGQRGMGALEFRPSTGPRPTKSHAIDVAALAELAAEVMAQRADLTASLAKPEREQALKEILRVGTSAGGARAKALIALDPETNEVRSGQLGVDPGFEHWILKFDGVEYNTRDLGASRGYGAIEWVYSRMAAAAGIEMTECRLLEENGRRHFMTRRFDRRPSGDKLHMQSLAGLAHLDYRQPGANSYEQAFQVVRRLGLPRGAIEQQFLRMAFNVVARNQDDHVKNIAFLMDREGRWSLSPAFDVVYAYNPTGRWTSAHQMSINGKRDEIARADLHAVAELVAIKRGKADELIARATEATENWAQLAAAAGIPEDRIEAIRKTHRLSLPRR
ncbi:MAG TPA: type II toxin-antitoxin system HipA family toxin [Solirubrobacterales bacterium]